MTNAKKRTLQALLAVVAGAGVLMINDVSPIGSGSYVSSAHAIIGRPLTPMSYAGVARRTTRRAYGYGAYGAGYAAPVVVGPACGQVVDVYGRVITQCY